MLSKMFAVPNNTNVTNNYSNDVYGLQMMPEKQRKTRNVLYNSSGKKVVNTTGAFKDQKTNKTLSNKELILL